jgi:hypothetical protein
MSRVLTALCLIVCGCTLGGGAGGPRDGAIDSPVEASLQVAPNPLFFQATAIGGSSKLELQVASSGLDMIRVERVELIEGEEDGEAELALCAGCAQGFDIERGGAPRAMTLEWRPVNEVADTATLRLHVRGAANAPGGVFEVPVSTPMLAPALASVPQVSFEDVPRGATASQVFFIQNSGQAELRLRQIVFEQPQPASLTLTFPDPDAADVEGAAESAQWRQVLKPGERIPVRVTFTPASDIAVRASLLIVSNDPTRPSHQIPVFGSVAEECVALNVSANMDAGSDATHRLDLDVVGPIGAVATRTLVVRNCSRTKALEIGELALVDDAGGAFEIEQDTLPEALVAGERLVLDVDEAASLIVSFVAGAAQVEQGRLVLATNDPVNPALKIDLVGRSTGNACPVAVASGVSAGAADGAPAAQLSAPTLSTIKLSGLGSYDADGAIAAYAWSILSKPTSSNARLSAASAAEPSIFLDRAGSYEIELSVVDDDAQASCERSRVTILAN